jgi:uncharacterized membrane protein
MVHAIQIKKEIRHMKKQTIYRWSFVLVLLSVPWVYLASIWNQLPATIPVHFGVDFKPDRYGPRNEIFFVPIVFTVISLVVYLGLTNIYKIDPKKMAKKQAGIFKQIALVMLVFMCFVVLMVLYWTLKQEALGINIFLVMMGLLFAYLGNVLHSIKPNYFAGFRLPWTLESEDNWRATHLMAGKIWFAGGLLIAVLAIFIKPFIMFFVMCAIILTMVLIPAIYSYRYFKREKLRQAGS